MIVIMKNNYKRIIKSFLPPILLKVCLGKRGIYFEGNYQKWEDAIQFSTGYDSALILEKVSASLLKVRLGQAAYERDSVLFDRIEYPFPLIAGLLRAAALNGGKITVIDFGGSLGSTYYQCRNFFAGITELNWCVIEQENFVQRGKALFETSQLKFFFSIEECMSLMKPDLILFGSVLQYLEKPFEILNLIASLNIRHLIIDRTPFADLHEDHICIQYVPKLIYPASYPCRIFSESKLVELLSNHFNLISDFEALGGINSVRGGPTFSLKGMIWEKAKEN